MISLKKTLEAIASQISTIKSNITSINSNITTIKNYSSPFANTSNLITSYSISTGTQTWTATKDCVLIMSGCIQANAYGTYQVKQNGVIIMDYNSAGGCRHSVHGTVYIKKGDTIYMNVFSNNNVYFKFFGLRIAGC